MRRRFLLLAAGAVPLAGCAGAQVRYYRLAPSPGTPHPGTGLRIGVRSIGTPPGMSASAVPKPGGTYNADSYANDLWATPLAGMLQATMVQNLSQRLPGDTVLASGGAVGAPPDIYVEINIFAFAPNASGTITLQAQLATRHASGQDWQVQNFTAHTGGATTADMVAATMSTLWGQAADAVANMV
jgi:uncharacterized lipoprotein YmbA